MSMHDVLSTARSSSLGYYRNIFDAISSSSLPMLTPLHQYSISILSNTFMIAATHTRRSSNFGPLFNLSLFSISRLTTAIHPNCATLSDGYQVSSIHGHTRWLHRTSHSVQLEKSSFFRHFWCLNPHWTCCTCGLDAHSFTICV
jgi:hypothetical protein